MEWKEKESAIPKRAVPFSLLFNFIQDSRMKVIEEVWMKLNEWNSAVKFQAFEEFPQAHKTFLAWNFKAWHFFISSSTTCQAFDRILKLRSAYR